MRQRFSYLVSLVLLLVICNACQPHDPFCYQHPHGAKVRVNVDWSEFKEDSPNGMTLFLYPANDASDPIQHITHTTTHAVFELMPDNYTVMVHNQSAAEFGLVAFRDMGDPNTAWVYPTRRTSNWYSPIDDEILVNNPEWLAFDREEAVVTPEMVDGGMDYDEDHDHSTARLVEEEEGEEGEEGEANGDETVIATMVPQNVVYTLHVSVRIKGAHNFRAARAAFSGLADGYYIGKEEYSSGKVTHMMDDWTLKERTTNTDGIQMATITSQITCFGLPTGHSGVALDNTLRLSILLVDNETRVNRMFYVGNRIYQRTTNGSPLHLYLDLEMSGTLPDVDPATGDSESGFDVNVDDWGEEENKNIGL